MSFALPTPPDHSCIQAGRDLAGHARLTWRAKADPTRWIAVAFSAFWLCGWAAGEYFAATKLLDDVRNDFQILGWSDRLFLSCWLLFWTVGGLAVMASIYFTARHPPPEQLTFEPDQLRYETGVAVERSQREAAFGTLDGAPTRSASATLIPREAVQEVRLDPDEQSLQIQYREGRLVLGEHLREPEREWLAAVLRDWAA